MKKMLAFAVLALMTAATQADNRTVVKKDIKEDRTILTLANGHKQILLKDGGATEEDTKGKIVRQFTPLGETNLGERGNMLRGNLTIYKDKDGKPAAQSAAIKNQEKILGVFPENKPLEIPDKDYIATHTVYDADGKSKDIVDKQFFEGGFEVEEKTGKVIDNRGQSRMGRDDIEE